MTLPLELPSSYGYVVIVAIASIFVVMWMSVMVGKARKRFGVMYPEMYAVKGKTVNCNIVKSPSSTDFAQSKKITDSQAAHRRVTAAKDSNGQSIALLSDDDCDRFNCYQRAHQNTLENIGPFYILLLLGGVIDPIITSMAGVIWLAGRVVYCIGYYTGSPKKRMMGGFMYAGLLMMLGTSVHFAYRLLTSERVTHN
eukprot:GHVN01045726.1.p1 GENE.GHVN01045726.1~~GHVN01045726.1.p1  ORF type:complete len:197 (-),score=27.52 GHVN01045726.1:218-808(-)